MSKIEHAILATDLAIYFKKKSKFIEMVENGEWDWQDPDNKECKSDHFSFFIFINVSY